MTFGLVIVAGAVWIGAGLLTALSSRRLAAAVSKVGARGVWFTPTAFLVVGVLGLVIGVAILTSAAVIAP